MSPSCFPSHLLYDTYTSSSSFLLTFRRRLRRFLSFSSYSSLLSILSHRNLSLFLLLSRAFSHAWQGRRRLQRLTTDNILQQQIDKKEENCYDDDLSFSSLSNAP